MFIDSFIVLIVLFSHSISSFVERAVSAEEEVIGALCGVNDALRITAKEKKLAREKRTIKTINELINKQIIKEINKWSNRVINK